MQGSNNLYLIGPMGSGKTAVGRQLAKLLGRPFVDSDHEIEQLTGADIPRIFELEGEEGFRRREREVIAQLVQRDGIVLATGGGAVLDAGTRQSLRTRGWVAYLETSAAQQASRSGRTRHRPLLFGHDPEQRLAALYKVREPLYRETADFITATDHRKVSSVAELVLDAFESARGGARIQAS
jgi:shikimate kinase